VLRARRRARFIRRTGWFSFLPLWGLIWLAAISMGRHGGLARNRAAGLLLVCAAVAAAIAAVVRRLAGPLGDIVAAADRIAHRDYRVRVPVPRRGPAWVGDTARAFNAMAEELDAQDKARRHLMADVAHELRTPLAILQGKLEGLIDGVYARDDDELQGLLNDTRVLAGLVEDLRTLSTAEGGALALAREPTDIVALAADVVASLGRRAGERGVALQLDGAGAAEIPPIALDPLRIREVLINLVANALAHTPRGGQVGVVVRGTPRDVEIRVVDSGEGIPPDVLPRIFDRFYKGTGSSGSGLGLTIARSLVEAHGGTIRAESRVSVGTTMVVVLPR
jgi:signal transduction histidine kinase